MTNDEYEAALDDIGQRIDDLMSRCLAEVEALAAAHAANTQRWYAWVKADRAQRLGAIHIRLAFRDN